MQRVYDQLRRAGEIACVIWAMFILAWLTWFYPVPTLSIAGLLLAIYAVGTYRQNRQQWHLAWFKRRHPEVLPTIERIIAAHETELVCAMRPHLKFDGRDTSIRPEWVPLRNHFIETKIVPALPADHRWVVAAPDHPVRVEVQRSIDWATFDRCFKPANTA